MCVRVSEHPLISVFVRSSASAHPLHHEGLSPVTGCIGAPTPPSTQQQLAGVTLRNTAPTSPPLCSCTSPPGAATRQEG